MQRGAPKHLLRRARRRIGPSEALHRDTIDLDVLRADRAGARPYRATRCENASRCASPDRAERVPTAPHVAKTRRDAHRRIARERVPCLPVKAKHIWIDL